MAFKSNKDQALDLVVVNGHVRSRNELLYLLEQHGYRVRIDLEEARKLLREDRPRSAE